MSDALTRTERLAAHLPAGERARAAVAAAAFGATGGLVALGITGGWAGLARPQQFAGGRPDPALLGLVLGLPVAAGLGAALAGGPLWWLLVERDDEPARVRGAVAGATTAFLAHPLMWALAGVGAGLVVLADQGAAAVGAVRPGDVGAAVGGFLLVSGVGLLLTGVVTIPVGTATGVLLARVRRALPDDGERTPDDL